MTREEIEVEVCRAIRAKLPSGFSDQEVRSSISLESPGLGLDSVQVAELLVQLEDAHGVPLVDLLTDKEGASFERVVMRLVAAPPRRVECHEP